MKKIIGLSALLLGTVLLAGPSAYAVNQTTTTVGVDDGGNNGNTPVFKLAAGGAMTFGELDLSQDAVNGLYEMTATSTATVDVDDRRGLEDSDTSLPWRVTAVASSLKTAGDVALPTTAFKLTLGTPTTAAENDVKVNGEVNILGTADIVGHATVGRGKSSFAPAGAKISVAETAIKGSYSGTIDYTLVSGV